MTIRTGVILAVDSQLTSEQAHAVTATLSARFPGVTFAVAGGGRDSLVFQWDDGESDERFGNGTPA